MLFALKKAKKKFRPWGEKELFFYINTNPGQELLPLQKVASRGELSRISLALQVITAQKKGRTH
ncbi:hypothetical protein [Coxiella-like endosymbiont]|uniref:hypothetical protein n=1 Tax=Coxiella-like endosymbiont TaxID=1592897 RepID=UPI00272CFAB1|nr:hypothetical protein [Coxiella-like endosymbiont]